jgi:hypothetical protein
MNAERERMQTVGRPESSLEEAGPWYEWGPYLSERAWGTVREDYSADGDAWGFFPYEQARSRAYRWNEDGMGGISTLHQDLCLALGLWNGRDPILKERMFGLTGPQGNHGEDAKDYWWYLDATPSHSWLRWRYHYPQREFPYAWLIEENARRSRTEPEAELLDSGAFDDDRYWQVEATYAKATPTDIALRITVTNCGPEADTLHVLPTLWFRDTWSHGLKHDRPEIRLEAGDLRADHPRTGPYRLSAAPGPDGAAPTPLFCENETNAPLVFGGEATTPYPKDGINDHVVSGAASVNPGQVGTKAAYWYRLEVPAGETVELRLRLWSMPDAGDGEAPGAEWAGGAFDEVLADREREADDFYRDLLPAGIDAARAAVARQGFAGMIWGKQFYRYDVPLWLDGDPGEPPPPQGRREARNAGWRHFDSYDVLSMPDPWEYPWFAAWDLAFHTAVLAHIDPAFAKYQLVLMCREWFMHPGGALPAYEWNFDDVNPPVHAWAALKVFEIDAARSGEPDLAFLKRVFQKLLMNYTWWLNRVDPDGNHVFAGGFLGLDNIGPVDRSHLPAGAHLEQADGTAWMAFYTLAMMQIALRLAADDEVYEDLVTKFFEHFAAISEGISEQGLWDASDGFFYDALVREDGSRVSLRVKSLVGVIPLLATAGLTPASKEASVRLRKRFAAFMARRGIADLSDERLGFIKDRGLGHGSVISLVDAERLRRVLAEVLDESSLLGPYGVRSLSARHREEPFSVDVGGSTWSITYEPAESSTPMYGGNSNWRGPVWMPINYLLVEALGRYYGHLGPEFTIECPTGSGRQMTLDEVAEELRSRLIAAFLPGPGGRRPIYGDTERLQSDPRWNDAVTFFEYFHGDNGAGLGATHQTGWTGLVADLIAGLPHRD